MSHSDELYKMGSRKIGFELEFSGIELHEAAHHIQTLFGGVIEKSHRYRYHVRDTRIGDFRVELDARMMRQMASENALVKWGIDFDKSDRSHSIEDIVDRLTQTVVPLEIVMPPVPADQVEMLEELRAALQANGAQGTRSSVMYAFGMHINIECPDLEAKTLLAYLRSFILLYPWLLRKLKIDLTRKVMPFVDPFPAEYINLLLNPSYQPSKPVFAEDYLQHNPTRNRPLDLMPIWAIDYPEKVKIALDGEKNESRPTFHYRLPNSFIDDPNWRLSDELSYWNAVESLAGNRNMISKLSRLYLLQKSRKLIPFENHWIETTTILLDLDA